MGDVNKPSAQTRNPSRTEKQLLAASKSQNEEIREMSSVLKSFAKTLNDLAEKNEDVRNSLSELKQNNAEVLKHLSQHITQIAALEMENAKLFKQVKFLTEQVIQQDQYSRKDIVIMTGLIYEEGESRMNSPHPSPEY
jgi:septal ring factor EnvC (AmiA/AmiB activator)